jgi:outer membrane protein assembly factor BamE (lipoprotein component of BamABCDE complex)
MWNGIALLRTGLCLAALLALYGCVRYQSLDGVENRWRELPPDRIQPGTTSRAEVLDWLGPPSQVIALGDRTVFYYLSQEQAGEAKVFILWNDARDRTRYDRAVFFFDAEGVLEEYSIRDEVDSGK